MPNFTQHNPNDVRLLAEKSFAKSPISTRAMIWRGFIFLIGRREKTFTVNPVRAQQMARERFARMLRAPFEGESDKRIAAYWAPRVGKSERTVENWLAMTNSASIEDMLVVGSTHGLWESCRLFVGEDTRQQVLERISR